MSNFLFVEHEIERIAFDVDKVSCIVKNDDRTIIYFGDRSSVVISVPYEVLIGKLKDHLEICHAQTDEKIF